MHQGSPLLPIFHIVAQPPPSSPCCPRLSHTSHPTLPRSTTYSNSTYIRHRHPSRNSVLIHSLHVSKLSQYSVIHFTRPLTFYFIIRRTSSFLTLSIRDTPTQLLKFCNSRTFTFLLSALLIPYAYVLHNAVATITPSIKTLLHIYPQSFISQHTFQHSPGFIPLIYSAYHIPFTSSIRCHLRSQVLKNNLLPLTVRHSVFTHRIRPLFRHREHP